MRFIALGGEGPLRKNEGLALDRRRLRIDTKPHADDGRLQSVDVDLSMQAELRYHPDQDQAEIAGAFSDSLTDLLPLSRLHSGFDETDKIWAELEGLGLFGITLAEEAGGSGLGAAEEALIVIALGRRLVSPSVLATVGAAHAGGISAGEPIRRTAAAYLSSDRLIIVDPQGAQQVLLRSEGATQLIEADLSAARVVEDRLWLADLRELSGPYDVLAEFDAAQSLRLKLIEAAALAGMAEAALDMAVAYAGLREQFGRPIGSQQAIKHHCANMVIASRSAQAQVSFAAMAVDQGRADAALQVESALLVAGTAAVENAGKNIQIHGGIGFSDEADPHLVLKRAQVVLALAGGLEAATDRIADLPADI